MPKRGHDEGDAYTADDFVENDDGKAVAKKTKRSRTVEKSEASSKPQYEGGSKIWELSSGRTPRRVEITEFKKMHLVNIREYYEKDGSYLPGKKGISLTVDQYKAMLRAIPEINTQLAQLGVEIEEPAHVDEPMLQSEEEIEPQKRVKAKKGSKANIEATSDEEED